MLVMDWDQVQKHADFRRLIDSILQMYAEGCSCLERLTLTQPTLTGSMADSLIQPGWMAGKAFGIKVANVFYENSKAGLPTVVGSYLLFDGNTGVPLAYIDGLAETFVKTAANSAAASQLLSNPDAEVLLMMGAGKLAPYLIRAHATARPLKKVIVSNRTRKSAEELVENLALPDVRIHVSADLEADTREADIVCCATYSSKPILNGEWLKPGAHVDLVGGYRPDQREADDAVAKRSGGRIYVDARETTVNVAGDVIDPIRNGIIGAEDVVDMFEVAQGTKKGRRGRSDITVFKSGGGGHEDLAVALALYRATGGKLVSDAA